MTRLTNFRHMFDPKLCINFQLSQTFRTPDLENNTRVVRLVGQNTSICLLLLQSKLEGWKKVNHLNLHVS